MRILVLNLGNSSVRGGVFVGRRLTNRFRLPEEAGMTGAAWVRRLEGRIPRRLDRAVVASVVPARTRLALQAVRRVAGIRADVLTSASRHGLEIAYRRPAELGVDRLAAAMGARAQFPGRDLVVVDCGTATTVTAVSRSGRIVGGAIFPGVSLWPDMLARRTAQLPAVPVVRPRTVVGRSPREALQGGIFHGHAGAVREVVRLVGAGAFGRGRFTVVGTGGHAPAFAAEKLFTELAPDLILTGLFEFATQDHDHA